VQLKIHEANHEVLRKAGGEPAVQHAGHQSGEQGQNGEHVIPTVNFMKLKNQSKSGGR
jgi:hypothetical protein